MNQCECGHARVGHVGTWGCQMTGCTCEVFSLQTFDNLIPDWVNG